MRCRPPTTCLFGRIFLIFMSSRGYLVQEHTHTQTHIFPHSDFGSHTPCASPSPLSCLPFDFINREPPCSSQSPPPSVSSVPSRAPLTWPSAPPAPPDTTLPPAVSTADSSVNLPSSHCGEETGGGRAVVERCKEWTDAGTRVVLGAWGQVEGWI